MTTVNMTLEEHKKRHIELHKALDELLADFIANTGKFPSTCFYYNQNHLMKDYLWENFNKTMLWLFGEDVAAQRQNQKVRMIS